MTFVCIRFSGDAILNWFTGDDKDYFERSPINFVDRFSCPIILFQGLEDKVNNLYFTLYSLCCKMMIDGANEAGIKNRKCIAKVVKIVGECCMHWSSDSLS